MTAIALRDVRKAASELRRMQGSLSSWLYYRTRNDDVATGKVVGKLSTPAARQIILAHRDMAAEQTLASHLHALLSDTLPDASLPDPDLRTNPRAAVDLARLALHPEQVQIARPQATGMALPPLPVLIVAGVALVLLTAISSYASVARDRERYACIQAGACTDYGFWVKAAAIVVGGWVLWSKMGVREEVAKLTGKPARKEPSR